MCLCAFLTFYTPSTHLLHTKLQQNDLYFIFPQDILDFSISEDGHRSKAEIEGVTTFFQPETVRFGERVERPPDLAALAAKFTAKKRPNSASSSSSLSSFASSAIGTGGGNSQVSTADELAALREKVQAAYSQLRQRRIDQKLR